MTCSHRSCQCNGTPAQLCFWLSPELSRNHFTAPPPQMRSTREGAESSWCNTPSWLFTPALNTLLTKQWNDTHNLRERIASLEGGSRALLHVGGVAEIQSGLPCSSWLCSCTLELALWAPAPDTCACQHLCCSWEQLNTCSVLRHHHPPSQTPPGGLLELLKVFLPPFHFVSPVSGNDRVESELLMFCFSAVAFLNVTGDNPNSRSTELPRERLCGNVGTFHQELFLHWQSLPAIRNNRSESWAILDVCYHLPIYLDLFFLSGKKKPKTNSPWIGAHLKKMPDNSENEDTVNVLHTSLKVGSLDILLDDFLVSCIFTQW